MSIQAVAWVLEKSEATLGDRLVLIAIANHADRDGMNAYPSFDTLARESRLSRRQVITCIQNLERDGHIKVVRLLSGKSNFYTMLMGGEVSSPAKNVEVVKSTTLAGEVSAPQVVKSTALAGEVTAPEPRSIRPQQPNKQPSATAVPAAPATAKVSQLTRNLLNQYVKLFHEKFEVGPVINWGRNGSEAKKLIAQYGYDRVASYLGDFLDSSDPWVIQNGYTFGVFASKFTALLVARSGKANGNGHHKGRAFATPKTAGNADVLRRFVESDVDPRASEGGL